MIKIVYALLLVLTKLRERGRIDVAGEFPADAVSAGYINYGQKCEVIEKPGKKQLI
jgi:membrane-bound ClpP family serine protease